MTTKRKIIVGFLLSNILLIIVAVIGYQSLSRTMAGFTRYNVLAGRNVYLSDIGTELYTQAYNVERFLAVRDAQYAQAAVTSMKRCAELSATVLQGMQDENNKKKMQAVVDRCASYLELLRSIEENTLAWNDQYMNTLRPAAAELQNAMEEIGVGGRNAGNMNVLGRITGLWSTVTALRTQITLFAQSGSPDLALALDKSFADTRKVIETLRPYMESERGREDYARLTSSLSRLQQGVEKGKGFFVTVNQALEQARSQHVAISDIIASLNKNADTAMRQTAQTMFTTIDAAQTQMFGVSLFGVVVSLVFAGFIVFGLIRILSRVSTYAEAVAGGQFSHDPQVTEKGEIGGMVQALRRIPETLSNVISECNEASAKIACGDFRSRLDAASFRGGFRELAVGVNTVADSYTKVIDELPVSIMAADMNRSIRFLNRLAQGMAGGNTTGEHCGDKLRAPECSNDMCFGKQCVKKGATVNGEASVDTPQGAVHLSLAAMPLYDLKGEPAGCIEIITDVTQIRNQQIIMTEVARRALEISDRVAAASEELSAQVEQVSRGAEVQRSRVESTASAMTEMNVTVLEVAKNAAAASEQSDDTRTKAQDGEALVNQVKEAINGVNAVGNNLQSNMQELGKQAESIGSVMNVISDIADQTNLLALNAAIEAARAGEAGRGFAVVADEVRKLAEKTMQATQEVGASISAVQRSARVNIDEVGKAVESVAVVNGLANASGEALVEIVGLASANSSVVASIATAAEEQSATSDEINRAVDEINRIAAETTEGMIQSSEAVQDLSRMAQELKSVLDDLK
ncbi:MAG: hypothetical protein DELT_02706 [Desulfovibrio sp.]